MFSRIFNAFRRNKKSEAIIDHKADLLRVMDEWRAAINTSTTNAKIESLQAELEASEK